MTPKAKAKELIHRYDLMQTYVEGFSYYNAKESALIAVDEIINATKGMVDEDNGYSTDSYWQEVKHEIKLL